MNFKIVLFAAAVFTTQVNAQMGGIIRPFTAGFTNGLNEMAKPFVQLGQSVMNPASEYISGNRRPFVSQWMSYPSQIIPQAQASAYEGYEALTSGIPDASYFQAVRPSPSMFKPQTLYYQVSSQPALMRPPRPYPAPMPAPAPAPAPAPVPVPAPAPSFPSSSEETAEVYRPSNLLIKPNPVEVENPKFEEVVPFEEKFEVPDMQRPLPILEDQE